MSKLLYVYDLRWENLQAGVLEIGVSLINTDLAADLFKITVSIEGQEGELSNPFVINEGNKTAEVRVAVGVEFAFDGTHEDIDEFLGAVSGKSFGVETVRTFTAG